MSAAAACRTCLKAALVLALLASRPPAASPQPAGETGLAFLRRQLLLSESEVNILRRGQPVTKTFSSPEKREVAVGGAIHVRAEAGAFLDIFRDIESFRSTSEMVLQMGRFGEPPSETGLQALTVDAEDVESLRRCVPGDCKVRLPAADIERISREVDWTSPDRGRQVSRLFQDILLRYLHDYRAQGNAGLPRYDDHDEPLLLSRETRELVEATAPLLDHVPDFVTYLARYPEAPAGNVESFFYWSKDEFGFKPVISLTHVSIYTPDPARPHAVIASKQLYANHYFDGSLSVTMLLDDAAAPGRAFYMLYLNRTRNAKLAGFLGRLSRPMVHSRSRAGVEKSLRAIKARLEPPPS